MGRPRRILVLGISGGGKSTAASALGRALGLPVFHLDPIHWRTGEPGDLVELYAEVLRLIAHDRWILDGNYMTTAALPERLERAEAVLVIDVPRPTALWRATLRYVRQRLGRRNEHGNPPRLSPEFVRWIWKWPRTFPDLVESLKQQAPGTRVTVVRRREDLRRLIDELA